MIKLVNVYPNAPITTINPPIKTRLNNINMSVEDIRKCLIATAYVEEILDGRKTIPLDFSNYDKDNDLIPAEVIKTDTSAVEKETIPAEDLKETITTDAIATANDEATIPEDTKEAENNEDKSVTTESDIEKHNETKEDIKEQAPVENKKETSNNNVKNNNLKKAYVKPQNKK